MRFVGIDIGAEHHAVALVDEEGRYFIRPVSFGEEAAGYRRLRELLGSPTDCLVAMEATGHYWNNLFAWLTSRRLLDCADQSTFGLGALPKRNWSGPKPIKVDALGIARFAAQKHPTPTELPEPAIEELRQLVRLREAPSSI